MITYDSRRFSLNLLCAMRKAGMTKESLANAINLNPSTVSNYVHDSRLPSLTTALMIAKALSITVDELMKGVVVENTGREAYGTGVETRANKIIEFYNALPAGSYFTVEDIVRETGMSRNQVYACKHGHVGVSQLLANTRVSTRSYQKPAKTELAKVADHGNTRNDATHKVAQKKVDRRQLIYDAIQMIDEYGSMQ